MDGRVEGEGVSLHKVKEMVLIWGSGTGGGGLGDGGWWSGR